MADTMTKREFLAAVIESTVDENIKEFAENEIAKLDTMNAKRREKASEKNAEKVEMVKGIVDKYLGTEVKTASMIKDAMEADGFERADGKSVNTQFVSAVMRKAVELGLAKSEDVKITGKGNCKGYTLA